ncbi:MAG TPA: pseudoazurin [Rhizomicrobium sp.]|jgi:pseudoazurin|nr:pseudoazurin [Rhizomicrobium sp.]
MVRCIIASLAIAALAGIQVAGAADYQVRMLNQGMSGMMQYDPQLLKIAPGDTVRFIATDQGHNVQSVDGMIPAGAKAFSGTIGQNLTVTFTVPGVYGYRCTPHGTLGMVGLVVVGTPLNEGAARAAAMPGIAGRVFAKLFDALDSQRTAQK